MFQQAEENDGYPDFACYSCTSKLCIFATLHQTYLEASERLKALKNQLDLESKSNVTNSQVNLNHVLTNIIFLFSF
jgi:hypothetical protein